MRGFVPPHLGGCVRRVSHGLQVEDANLTRLPNPVGARDGLLLVLRVGIRIIDDDRVGRLQVQPPPSSTDGQKEEERGAVFGIEALDGRLPVDSQPTPQPQVPS